MNIDRLSPIPELRPAAGDIGDLLGRLRAAGSVEAEVIRVLKNQLLLRSELGEILARNRLDLRPGDRVRIRLAGSDSDPVLRVSLAPQRSVTIAATEVPHLARALPADRPALAEIVRTLPRSTEIRLAGKVHSLPLRIATTGDSLLALERRPAARAIELRPLARAPIYRALLRHLLPRQASTDADSLVQLVAHLRPRAPESTRAAEGAAAVRAIAPGMTSAPAHSAPTIALAQRHSPAPASDMPRPPAIAEPTARTTMAEPRPQPASPAVPARADPTPVFAASATLRPAVSASIARGSLANREPLPAASAPASRAPVAAGPSPDRSLEVPPARSRGARNQVFRAQPAGAGTMRPDSEAMAPSPLRLSTPARGSAAAGDAPPATIPLPLARLLDWLPRGADIDAPRLRHWIELLGFARPTTSTGARAPDLVDWLRQLQAFDASAREPAIAAARRQAPARAADGHTGASDDREASPALPRESLRLAEQVVTHNLLQRVTAGLQQEMQQPLNLSLTLPFVDGAEVRPLRIDLEQRGGRGASDSEPAWDVRVNFEFGALGPITCHLVLAGRALAASFYCEFEATREQVASALPELRRQLDAAGFEPGELHSYVGRGHAPQPATPVAAEYLIDLEA